MNIEGVVNKCCEQEDIQSRTGTEPSRVADAAMASAAAGARPAGAAAAAAGAGGKRDKALVVDPRKEYLALIERRANLEVRSALPALPFPQGPRSPVHRCCVALQRELGDLETQVGICGVRLPRAAAAVERCFCAWRGNGGWLAD